MKSPIDLPLSGIVSVFHPPLIPAALRAIRLHCLTAGIFEESFQGLSFKFAVVPPQNTTTHRESNQCELSKGIETQLTFWSPVVGDREGEESRSGGRRVSNDLSVWECR